MRSNDFSVRATLAPRFARKSGSLFPSGARIVWMIHEVAKAEHLFTFDSRVLHLRLLSLIEMDRNDDALSVWEAPGFQVRIMSDLGRRSIACRPDSRATWYDLAQIRGLIEGSEPDLLSLSFEDDLRFLKENAESIARLFAPENLAETKELLAQVRRQRALRRFPFLCGEKLFTAFPPRS